MVPKLWVIIIKLIANVPEIHGAGADCSTCICQCAYISSIIVKLPSKCRTRQLTLPVLGTLLRLRFIIQTLFIGSYMHKSAGSKGRFNVGVLYPLYYRVSAISLGGEI